MTYEECIRENLPEEYANLAISNFYLDVADKTSPEQTVGVDENISSVLSNMYSWYTTPQGDAFWRKVWKYARTKREEDLPRFTKTKII